TYTARRLRRYGSSAMPSPMRTARSPTRSFPSERSRVSRLKSSPQRQKALSGVRASSKAPAERWGLPQPLAYAPNGPADSRRVAGDAGQRLVGAEPDRGGWGHRHFLERRVLAARRRRREAGERTRQVRWQRRLVALHAEELAEIGAFLPRQLAELGERVERQR